MYTIMSEGKLAPKPVKLRLNVTEVSEPARLADSVSVWPEDSWEKKSNV
jgi:hypothetical protein